jgi:hypothetical protein
VMSNLKTGGMRDLLEDLVARQGPIAQADAPDQAAAEAWTPVV